MTAKSGRFFLGSMISLLVFFYVAFVDPGTLFILSVPQKIRSITTNSSIGPIGVFPRQRPRLIHNILFLPPKCEDKVGLIRQWKGDAVVVEVGAFRGGELFDFKGFVRKFYTYEPSPPKFSFIHQANIDNEMESVVTFRPVAASDRSGEATFYVPLASGGTEQDSFGNIEFMDPSRRSIKVPMVRLDEEIFERVHLLKIDTQGHELSVLKGAEGIIRTYGIDVIHTEFAPGLIRGQNQKPEDFLEYVWQLGYSCMYCNNPFGHPPDSIPQNSGKRSGPWAWKKFSDDFGECPAMPGPGHGAHGDLICI